MHAAKWALQDEESKQVRLPRQTPLSEKGIRAETAWPVYQPITCADHKATLIGANPTSTAAASRRGPRLWSLPPPPPMACEEDMACIGRISRAAPEGETKPIWLAATPRGLRRPRGLEPRGLR